MPGVGGIAQRVLRLESREDLQAQAAKPGAPAPADRAAREVPGPRVYLKTQNCTKRQEKDIKGFYHRQYKEVIV